VTEAFARPVAWLRWVATWLIGLFVLVPNLRADEKFDVLQVGANTYSNATVISKNSSHVSITHSKGFASLKVKDLDPEIQTQLGYVLAEPPKEKPNAFTQITQITSDSRVVEMQELWNKEANRIITQLDTKTLAGIGAGVVMVYLFLCYCSMLICRKAGHEPGVLIWIPGIQFIPMLRAAGMSGWTFILLLLPVVGAIVYIIWCFKICTARKKSAALGLLLLLPVISLFVFLYLAFSDGQQSEEGGVVKLQFS